MSRRRVWAIQPGWFWEYGWDPRLQTFFAQLLPVDRELDSPVEWYGGIPGAVISVEDLMSRMGLELSAEQVAQLERDRASDSEAVDLRLPLPPGGPPLVRVAGRPRGPREQTPPGESPGRSTAELTSRRWPGEPGVVMRWAASTAAPPGWSRARSPSTNAPVGRSPQPTPPHRCWAVGARVGPSELSGG
jgi:hypothetical protein